jgi:biopolymer transport protein ExbD
MTLHRRKRKRPEDSSAMSDIAFLLIIYFIVIAGFNVNKGFLLNLPAKDSARVILKDDLLRFELDGTGSLIFQNSISNTRQAESELRASIAYHPNLAVILTISPTATWQRVVTFVELAQRCDVDSFSFTIKKDGP